MLRIIICCFCLAIGGVIILGASLGSNYTQGLIKYLEEESKLYQVIFIIDDRLQLNTTSGANSLVKDVSGHFPSLSVSLDKMRFDLRKHFPPLAQRPRRTTLFVLILDDQNNTFVHVMLTLRLLKQLSDGHSYPKCLINLVSRKVSDSFEQHLKYFWLNDFFDIAILEHLAENHMSLKCQGNYPPTLHEVNLFAKVYRVQMVNQQTRWFPNKLLNLYGYPMKFLLCTFEDTLSHLFYKVVNKVEGIFSHSMNCSTRRILDHTRSLNLLQKSFDKRNAEFLLNNVIVHTVNDAPNNPILHILRFEVSKAVIPNTSSLSNALVVSQELIDMLVGTIIAIAILRITAFILQFNRATWETFNISQILMGLSIIREPVKLAERIVFGALILSCIVYSGYLYSVILDITFLKTPEISSLEELANSSLTPMMVPGSKASFLASSIPAIKKLGTKLLAFPGRGTVFNCLDHLVDYGNVTCITTEVEVVVNRYTMKRGKKLNVKILEEPLSYSMMTFATKSGSPFLDRFNEVIVRAFDLGFLARLLYFDVIKQRNVSPPEEIEKEKLLLIFFCVLTIGYLLATIAFLAEVMISVSCYKVKRHCPRFCNSIRGILR